MGSEALPTASEPEASKRSRPRSFRGTKRLGWLERTNIRFIRWGFTNRWLDRLFALCHRTLGTWWIDYCTRNLRHVHGLDRIPSLHSIESFVLVSNHRSFFDMYVLSMLLYKHGFRKRLLFPVRSSFFYDHPLGFFVNGIMSFFSMYPPIFRDRKRASLNFTAFCELAALLQKGRSAGIHPEGTRKRDDDPYTFLPAQSGVGRAIHAAQVSVIPVFVNGLGNDFVRQIWSNFDGTGKRVIACFGHPIEFGALLSQPGSSRVYRAIAEQTMEVISVLGQEEKRLREAMESGSSESQA